MCAAVVRGEKSLTIHSLHEAKQRIVEAKLQHTDIENEDGKERDDSEMSKERQLR